MKLTTPIKSIHDIVVADDITRILVVSISNDLHICITQMDTKGGFIASSMSQYAGTIRVTRVSYFDNRLKQISCSDFTDYPILCNFTHFTYVCEDLFMAARLIHAAMEDLQKVCETFDIDPRTSDSVGTIIEDCFHYVVLTAGQPGGLISQYKKDLRRGTPIKLPDNYFDVFPIGF